MKHGSLSNTPRPYACPDITLTYVFTGVLWLKALTRKKGTGFVGFQIPQTYGDLMWPSQDPVRGIGHRDPFSEIHKYINSHCFPLTLSASGIHF